MGTSTFSPPTANKVCAVLSDAGAEFVDAPVSGGAEGARNGKLTVMAGGEFANILRVMPILETISDSVTHMDPVGAGQATKAVNQVMIAGIAEAVCEALAFSEKLNLLSQRLLSVVSGIAADSWFLDHRGQSMLEKYFDGGFKLSLLLKYLNICKTLAQDLNISMPTVKASAGDYRALVELGDGDYDRFRLVRLKRGTNQLNNGSSGSEIKKRTITGTEGTWKRVSHLYQRFLQN